jgi:hypothetical protein
MMTRSRLSCIVTTFAMIGWVGVAIAEPPPESGRLLSARAHHEHGNRVPLWPTSPARPGIYRVEGVRIYQASAVHPFSVGFYPPSSTGEVNSVELLLGRKGHHRGGELWVNVPLGD